MFDLDKAIATWRHVLKNERAVFDEDLDELEQHLRDQIPWLIRKGMHEEEAFRHAVREMGNINTIQHAYRDVFWKKTKHRRKLGDELRHRGSMIINYLKVTLRILRRNPVYSTIKIAGLALGLASCIVIFLFVSDELSFDRFHTNADDIYRIYRVEHRVGSPLKVSEGSMSPLATAIRESVPGVVDAARYLSSGGTLYREDSPVNVDLSFVDPEFLEMFDFSPTGGSNRLDEPSSVVFTESASSRYFDGDLKPGDPVDLMIGGEQFAMSVTEIIPDPPSNSSFQFDILLPYSVSSFYRENGDSWTSNSPSTYVQLVPKTSTDAVMSAFAQIVSTNLGEIIRTSIENGWFEDREDTFQLRLQPLADVHLNPRIDSFTISVSDAKYSFILGAIALGILLIACVNFMTIALGRAITRSREVGMRKSLGAARRQIMTQFWGEALLMSFLAVLIGIMLSWLALPVFNELSGKELEFAALASLRSALVLLGLVLLCAFIAGLYPSVLLSGFKPMSALTSSPSSAIGRRFSRSVIVFQFVVSIVMIVAVLVMNRQMNFIDSQDLGFEPEQLVVVSGNSTSMPTDQLANLLQERFAGIPGVVSTSGTSSSFGDDWSRTVIPENDVNHIVYHNRVDPSFLETMGVSLVEGRNLSTEFQTDPERAVLVNRAFANDFGWESPVGQLVPGYDDVTVVGVVDDYKFLSIRQQVPPVMLHMSPNLGSENFTLVRFRAEALPAVMQGLEGIWSDLVPDRPFVTQFMDERLALLYENDHRWQSITTYASILALLISCMGLFGVAALSAAQRRKEIGVRKVLGASVGSIVLLLSKDFARLVVVGFVIAVPLAWYVMSLWLDGFAYRVSLGAGTFLVAGLIALAVALLTVSRQSISAAISDPVNSIRTD